MDDTSNGVTGGLPAFLSCPKLSVPRSPSILMHRACEETRVGSRDDAPGGTSASVVRILSGGTVRIPAHLGPGIRISGQIAGNEDLKIDGEVDGPISLVNHRLTVGASGRVRGEIVAREVVIYGMVVGDLRAAEWIEIKRDASVCGTVVTPRVTIEEGARFKGAMEIDNATALGADRNTLLALAEKDFKLRSIRSAGHEDALKM